MTCIKSDNPLKLGIKSTMSSAIPRTLFDLIPHYRGFSLTEHMACSTHRTFVAKLDYANCLPQ